MDVDMQDDTARHGDTASLPQALPSPAQRLPLHHFVFNDGHFPDDVKLTIMSQYPSLKQLALMAKCNRNQRFLVPCAVDMRFLAMLRRYFGREGSNIVRSHMRVHRIVIAGSEGVRMAQGEPKREDPAKDGEDWEPENLDFFAPEGETKDLEDELVRLGAKEFDAPSVPSRLPRRAIKSVKSFILNDKTIFIHESFGPRAVLAVLDSWTTCIVVATADFIVALYPTLTLNNEATLHRHDLPSDDTDVLEKKFAKRGIKHFAPYEVAGRGYCLADWATIGESAKVCVMPMHHANWNAVPVEFAGRFRWRADVTCYDTTCAVHWSFQPKRSLLQELRQVAFSK